MASGRKREQDTYLVAAAEIVDNPSSELRIGVGELLAGHDGSIFTPANPDDKLLPDLRRDRRIGWMCCCGNAEH